MKLYMTVPIPAVYMTKLRFITLVYIVPFHQTKKDETLKFLGRPSVDF